jgi:hypothetical protein
MPNYPTDNVLTSTLSINNVSDYREPKLQTVEVTTAANGVCTTAVAHGLQIHDTVIFTATQGSIVLGTTYYVETIPLSTTFTVEATIGGGTVGGAVGTSYYYTPNGTITGAELTGYTDTISDFADVWTNRLTTAVNENADVIPASSAVSGNSVLAKLAKEITLFYDVMNPSRLALAVTGDNASDTFASTTAHGYSVGDALYFTATTGGMDLITPYYVIPFIGADIVNGTITLANHTFSDNDHITVITGQGALVAGDYHVTNSAPGTFTLSILQGGVTVGGAIGNITFTAEKFFNVSATTTGLKFANTGGANHTYLAADYLTSDDLKYIANAKSLKINDLQAQALKILFELKRLTAEVANINSVGALPEGMYPSSVIY